MRIGIVTCEADRLADYFPTAAEPAFIPTELPFTPDDQLLVDELRRRGHEVSAVVWGDEVSGLAARFDRLIVRSAWDYMDSDTLRQRFLRWLEQLAEAGMPVENEVAAMLWLMDKSYLLDFATVGVPIVPTRLVRTGESFDLAAFASQSVGTIVKPAVSAAGVGLEYLPDPRAASEFQPEFARRCQCGPHLVQPFIPEIRTHGEWSLVYLGGEYSHGVHKLPAHGQILVHAERGGSLRFADPPASVRRLGDLAAAASPRAFATRGAFAERAFATREGHFCPTPLYLRIDIIETNSGCLLSECEGVEPELFFRARPASTARFAALLEQRTAGRAARP